MNWDKNGRCESLCDTGSRTTWQLHYSRTNQMKRMKCEMKNGRYLPGKCWVGTLFHTLAPRFTSKCWIPCAFIEWTTDRRAIIGISTRHVSFNWSIEIHTNAVACFAGIFVGQRKYKRRCFTYCISCTTRSNIYASFRLTKVNHVQWHGEIGMIVWWITTQ